MQSGQNPEADQEGLHLTDRSREQLEQYRSAHETQILTILLSDLVGSTGLQSKAGNIRAAEVVRQHREIFREVLQRFDGREVETAGDSFLVIFAAPSEGVKFALHMQAAMRHSRRENPQLPLVRVGIHQGQVVVEHHETGPKRLDVYGLQISTAARIMDLACGDQILCSRAVFDDARAILCGNDFQGLGPVGWQNHGPYRFKGVDDSYDLCEVGEEGSAPFVSPPAGPKGRPAGQGEEELGWRPAAGVTVPGTNWVLRERLGKEADPKDRRARFRGEFGEVWKAWNASQKAHEVFKFCFKRDRVPVLKREARLLKQLQKHRHPNLVEVYDVTEGDRPPYYLEMEYVEGPLLEEWIATNPLLSERLEIVAQVADALDSVHAAGIYHRDIKPSNILLTRREDGALQAKLTDFGLGAAEDQDLLKSIPSSEVEGTAGTWDFIAPELRRGGKASPQSDIYSLGLTLFQLATGDLTGQAAPGWEQLINSEVLRDDIARCMASDPSRRWRKAADLAMALRSHDGRVERLRLEREQAAQHRRRTKVLFAGGLLAAFLAVISVIIIAWQVQKAGDARAAADAARLTASDTGFALASLEIEKNRVPMSLAYLADALRKNPGNEKATALTVSILRDCRIPVACFYHGDEVRSAGFSPDGRRAVTTSADGTARLWDVTTGHGIGKPMTHNNWVHAANFSHDGRLLVTASWDSTVRVWNAQNGDPAVNPNNGQPIIIRHEGRVNTASFSPDDRVILTASWDKTARLWDARTGDAMTHPSTSQPVVMRHGGVLWNACLSPDGTRVLTASADGTARLWDYRTGDPAIHPRTGDPVILRHADEVNHACFSPDGQWVATASDDKTARLWNARTGEPVTHPASQQPVVIRHDLAVNSIGFSSDSARIITASSDNTAKVWDALTGSRIDWPMHHDGWVVKVGFSPEGRWVVTASQDGTARLWDARTGKPLGSPLYHSGTVYGATFSNDGEWVITASFDGTARIWSVSGGLATNPMTHGKKVNAATFSPDSRSVVTASEDGTARLWDVRTGIVPVIADDGKPAVFLHNGPVDTASFSPDGNLILTSSGDGTARVWNAHTGQPIKGGIFKHEKRVRAAKFNPDGVRIVTASVDGAVRLWDISNGKPLKELLKHTDWVTAAEFSPDGKKVVTVSHDGTARVWNAATGELLLDMMGHSGRVFSAGFSPDGIWIVTGAADHRARIWDSETGQPIGSPMRHAGWIYSSCFSPDGHRVVTSSSDGTARVWDARTGHPTSGPLRHQNAVVTACFSPDGKWVLTASEDRTARIWDSRTGYGVSPYIPHPGKVASAGFSPDGHWIVTASEDGAARTWEAPLACEKAPPWLMELAEAVGGLQVNDKSGLGAAPRDIIRLRRTIGELTANDRISRFGRWLVSNVATRPPSWAY